MPIYLSTEQVIEINIYQVMISNEPHGVRSMDSLESAVARPQSGYYPDLIAEAAALWESLAGNHPFINGNKRTAFEAVHVFLKMNGLEITASNDSAIDFIAARYATNPHTMNHENLDRWLRENTSGQ